MPHIVPSLLKRRRLLRKRRGQALARMKGLYRRAIWIAFGKGRYALQALEPAGIRIPAETIEAGRRALRRSVADVGICILPDEHVFRNFTESRWRLGYKIEPLRYKIEPGDVLYEIWGVTETTARRALTRAASKMPTLPGDTMPIKTQISYIKIFDLLY